MFDAYTIRGSLVTPRTAGMESIAKTKSESSMQRRQVRRGVAVGSEERSDEQRRCERSEEDMC